MTLRVPDWLRTAVVGPIAIDAGFARDAVVALLRLPFFALAVACAAGVGLTLIFLIATLGGIVAGYSPPTTTIFRWFAWARVVGAHDQDGVQAVLVISSLCAVAALFSKRIGGGSVDELSDTLERFLSRWGFPVIAALFIFTISGTWAGLVRVQDFNGASIGGMVPFSDAAGYAGAAYDAVDGGKWNAIALRRPFAAAFREILLLCGGLSYANMLLVQGALAALATWLAARSVAQWAGAAAGFAFLCLAFAVQRSYLITVLTEPLGLIWSLLSIPFFVFALRYNSLGGAYTALGLTVIALLTRMGAMFLVPALIFWMLLFFGETVWQKLRILAVCVVIVAAGLSLNQLLVKIHGSAENLTGSNFAYSLCGLSIGDSWSVCSQKYAAEIEALPSDEKAQTDFLYAKAIDNIRYHPTTVLLRLLRGGLGFLSRIPVVVSEGYFRPPPSKIFSPTIFVVIAICGLALSALLDWDPREATFWLLVFAAIVASSMFVYFDDGLRVMSASYPLVALLFVRGLRQSQRPSDPTPSEWKLVFTGGLIAALVGIGFLGIPALAAEFVLIPSLGADVKSAEELFIYGGRRMSGFVIVPDNQEPLKNVPSMTLKDFQAIVRSSGVEQYQGLVLDVDPPPAPFAFIYSPRAGPHAQAGLSYIVPPKVFIDKAVPMWRLTIREWHKKSNFGSYWFLATRADPVLIGQ